MAPAHHSPLQSRVSDTTKGKGTTRTNGARRKKTKQQERKTQATGRKEGKIKVRRLATVTERGELATKGRTAQRRANEKHQKNTEEVIHHAPREANKQ